MKHMGQSLLLVLLLVFSTPSAQAITLAELFNGGSLVAGDKLFDSWELLFYDSSEFDRSLNAGNIDVLPLHDGGLNPGPGLDFNVLNGELTVTGDGLYAYVDLMFGFRVSVLDPLLRITDNSLELTSGSLSYLEDVEIFNDLGFYIRETIGTSPWDDDLGIKEVEFSLLNGTQFSFLSDIADFDPQSEIWVTKNILVWAFETTDTAELLGFNQRYSQTVVPEPTTWLLMLLGGAGLVAARRKGLF